jgi:hypothetical protein
MAGRQGSPQFARWTDGNLTPDSENRFPDPRFSRINIVSIFLLSFYIQDPCFETLLTVILAMLEEDKESVTKDKIYQGHICLPGLQRQLRWPGMPEEYHFNYVLPRRKLEEGKRLSKEDRREAEQSRKNLLISPKRICMVQKKEQHGSENIWKGISDSKLSVSGCLSTPYNILTLISWSDTIYI